MTSFKRITIGMAAALLLAGITTGAQGFATGGGAGVAGSRRGPTILTGHVLCAGCSLEEMRKTQPNQQQLYQFTHKLGQVVMRVSAVDSPHRGATLPGPQRSASGRRTASFSN